MGYFHGLGQMIGGMGNNIGDRNPLLVEQEYDGDGGRLRLMGGIKMDEINMDDFKEFDGDIW